MGKLGKIIWSSAILLSLISASSCSDNSSSSSYADKFVPQSAFCERKTFRLESIDEVQDWFNYLGGLRIGLTELPSMDCPGNTIHEILDIFTNSDEFTSRRNVFAISYANAALESKQTDRTTEQSENFRYLNDVTLASFLWVLCPDEGKKACIEDIVRALPATYLETSPVFCDFAQSDEAPTKIDAIEWPREASRLPLLCSASDKGLVSRSNRVDSWFERYEASFLTGFKDNSSLRVQGSDFVPQSAFCERETFRLESVNEVQDWIGYLGGLGSGKTEYPSLDCPSSTVRKIAGILSGSDASIIHGTRDDFAMSYVSISMMPDSSVRLADNSGYFRYLNDATLASFLRLLCPEAERQACVEEVVLKLPLEYRMTSPVFCDFVKPDEGLIDVEAVEWPRDVSGPLHIAESGAIEWARVTSGIPFLCFSSDKSSDSWSTKVGDWFGRYDAAFSNK